MTVVARPAPFAPPVADPAGIARVRFRAMGTDVEALLPIGREAAADVVVSIFETWERRCSRFDPTSELSRMNAAAGAPVVVSQPLFDAISTAIHASRASGGVFDPTILRRLEALGYDRTFAAVPADAPDAPADAPWSGAWDRVLLDRPTRTVLMPAGVGIDLGGIAKGMTVDAAVAALAGAGIEYAAVNAGGDLAVLGTPPGAIAWWVGVETADGGEVVALERGALATSSVADRSWLRAGRTMNHLVDPRTGGPADTGLVSVSVTAGTCTQAEVAAKTALLLGLEEGAAFLAAREVSALAIDDAGGRHRIGRWVEPPGSMTTGGSPDLPARGATSGGHLPA